MINQIQETWLKAHLHFKTRGYNVIRQDGEGGLGGGCETFIKEILSYVRVLINHNTDL